MCVCVCGARICTRENERKERRRRGYCERPDTFVACVHSTQPPGAATVPSGAEMTSAYLIPVNEETFLSLSTSSHSSSCSSNSLSPSAPSPCASISLSLAFVLFCRMIPFICWNSFPLRLETGENSEAGLREREREREAPPFPLLPRLSLQRPPFLTYYYLSHPLLGGGKCASVECCWPVSYD